MRQHRTISASMEKPHSPKTPSSPAAADTLSALLEDLGAQPQDFDCIVTGDLGHIGADLLLTLLRDMHRGKIHRLVFAGTGAMMSPTSVQQGQPIAGICHAVVLERSEA